MWTCLSRLVGSSFTGSTRNFSSHGTRVLLAKVGSPNYYKDRENDITSRGKFRNSNRGERDERFPERRSRNDDPDSDVFGQGARFQDNALWRQDGKRNSYAGSASRQFNLSRDGPSQDRRNPGSYGQNRTCYKCGEEGHISRECTNDRVQKEQRPDRRMERDDMRGSRGSSGSRGESNANFSEIGVPSKWKVGAGFQEYAETLRHKVKNYGDFKKGNTANSRNRSFERESRPKVDIKDRGIRRLAPIVMEEERENVSPDELDEEVDVMKASQAYDLDVKDRGLRREQVQMQIVKKKYFKDSDDDSEGEKKLTWLEKEQLRLLHQSDPIAWDFDMLAERFQIQPQAAKAIATGNWEPRKPKNSSAEMISGGGEEEVFPLTTTTSEQPVAPERPKSSRSNRSMTWKEARANMGHPEDDFNSPVVPKDGGQPRYLNDQEDVNILKADNDLVLKYLTKEGAPSKWNQNQDRPLQESTPELKTDTEKGVDYVYDTKHGYQHPFGKPEDIEEKGDIKTMVKEDNNLYRKGDAFYSEEGEFVYRVPGLDKKVSST